MSSGITVQAISSGGLFLKFAPSCPRRRRRYASALYTISPATSRYTTIAAAAYTTQTLCNAFACSVARSPGEASSVRCGVRTQTARLPPLPGGYVPPDDGGLMTVRAVAAMDVERLEARGNALVLGVVLFLGSELMFFASWFAAYYDLRVRSAVWPPPGVHISWQEPTLGAGLLIISDVISTFGVKAVKSGHRGRAQTLIGGAGGAGSALHRAHAPRLEQAELHRRLARVRLRLLRDTRLSRRPRPRRRHPLDDRRDRAAAAGLSARQRCRRRSDIVLLALRLVRLAGHLGRRFTSSSEPRALGRSVVGRVGAGERRLRVRLPEPAPRSVPSRRPKFWALVWPWRSAVWRWPWWRGAVRSCRRSRSRNRSSRARRHRPRSTRPSRRSSAARRSSSIVTPGWSVWAPRSPGCWAWRCCFRYGRRSNQSLRRRRDEFVGGRCGAVPR